MRFCRLSLRREDVLGIGRLVVYLFRRYITFFYNFENSLFWELSSMEADIQAEYSDERIG